MKQIQVVRVGLEHGTPDYKSRAVHRGAPGRKTQIFNVVFEFAELFLVAMLFRNHKKIN